MQSYITKRILLFIPTLLLVTLMVFLLIRFIPGDPALLMLLGADGQGQYTQEQLDNLRARLGTDRPIYIQYADWVGSMFQGDFGTSLYHSTPVAADLADRLPVTLELTILGMLIAIVVAVPLGVLSAVKQDTLGDYIARIISITGIALPTFWVGILMIYFLVLFFGWLPPLYYEQIWDDPLTNLQQLIFPAIALGFYNMAFMARVTRSSMLEVLREDYIRTARAKGLWERLIVFRHALKNAFLPVLTLSGWQFGRLLAGTVIIETVFQVPGMGRLLLSAIFQRDYTMIMGIVMVVAILVLVLNLIVDLVYGWLDPRIRYA